VAGKPGPYYAGWYPPIRGVAGGQDWPRKLSSCRGRDYQAILLVRKRPRVNGIFNDPSVRWGKNRGLLVFVQKGAGAARWLARGIIRAGLCSSSVLPWHGVNRGGDYLLRGCPKAPGDKNHGAGVFFVFF